MSKIHTYVYYYCYNVNDTMIVANNIDKAISIYREYEKDKDVIKARRVDDEYYLTKIATTADIEISYGKED